MSDSNRLFAEQYDVLYSQKKYDTETRYLLKAWEKFGKGKIKRILDLGSGTGNHAINVAEKGYSVVGMDVDNAMVRVARKKAKMQSGLKIEFVKKDITRDHEKKKYEMVYSMFYVINYLNSVSFLLKFFRAVNQTINKGGLYIFDCFNGNAFITDPPKAKEIDVQMNSASIKGTLVPLYDEVMNSAVYRYSLIYKDESGVSHKIKHDLTQTYWSPGILLQILKESGFKEVRMFKHLSFNNKVTNADFKLCFVCSK